MNHFVYFEHFVVKLRGKDAVPLSVCSLRSSVIRPLIRDICGIRR